MVQPAWYCKAQSTGGVKHRSASQFRFAADPPNQADGQRHQQDEPPEVTQLARGHLDERIGARKKQHQPDHHRPQHGQLPKGPRASRHHGPTGPAAAAGGAAGFAFGADAESFWRARSAKSLSPLAATSRSTRWPRARTLPKLEPRSVTPHS